MSVDLGIDLRVIISMMMLYNANAIIEYDRRRLRLRSAPLDMEHNNLLTQYRDIVL